MVRIWFVVGLVAVAFWVFTIVDCAVQPPTRHRGVSKGIWILIVVLLPILGGLLWLTVGRMRKSQFTAKPVSPDDDPDFLGRLGAVSDQDERIRRLEEELALLDAEDDDPRWAAPPIAETPAPGSAPSVPGATAPEPPARGADGDDDVRGQRGALG